MPLRLIIENTPSDELAPMPEHPSATFIEEALPIAKASKAKTRGAIMVDICNILNCDVEDLNFLFDHKTVPTTRRAIFDLELPDYRMSLSEIYKEAAE